MNLDNRYHEPLFPISTAAKLLNVSVQTLRLYEKEGLVISFKKSSKHRLYSKADIERIECIRKAITEKKMLDVLLQVRDAGLYEALALLPNSCSMSGLIHMPRDTSKAM